MREVLKLPRYRIRACSSFSSFSHSEDYCSGTENDVSTCPYLCVVGGLFLVYENVASLICVEAWSCAYEEWV